MTSTMKYKQAVKLVMRQDNKQDLHDLVEPTYIHGEQSIFFTMRE